MTDKPVKVGKAGQAGAALASPSPAPAPAVAAGRLLSVRAVREGFRRAGRAWSVEPVTVAAAEFTPEQLAQILAEPLLVVAEVIA